MAQASTLVVLLGVVVAAFAQTDLATLQALRASGLSNAAIIAISQIASQHQDALKQLQINPASNNEGVKALNDDIEKFLATASAADQAAWKNFEAQMTQNYIDGYTKVMKESGLSDAAIAQITVIAKQHEAALKAAQGNPGALQAGFEILKADIEAYIATASPADQAAWKVYSQKVQALEQAAN
ncbi:unnamed protein product [Caenorhabditis auriculariae]|uniref:SXP/RAL-2 family protein Ani s 5-like cation-binding domain-containing protein n=1 Tax=Caenorhabditis auriculariae TaxID=2777116 RepID=A0A8S1H349_9PELO|nr:unnamed protein product [Caenorhabditis auriculariae]